MTNTNTKLPGFEGIKMQDLIDFWESYEEVSDPEYNIEPEGYIDESEYDEVEFDPDDITKNNINDTKINWVQVEKIPLDDEYFYDMMIGNGIELNSVESFDKKNKKIWTGLQSEFFGTDFSSDAAFKERYTCRCGKYVGKGYKGMICDACGFPVDFHDIDLKKTGWIVIPDFKIINPIYYVKLLEALGKADGEYVLHLIIGRDYSDNIEKAYENNERMMLLSKKHPFIQKGMIWLSENLEEVIDYYYKKKPTKRDIFDELRAEQHQMWSSAIPVYTSLLRTELPGEKGSRSYMLKINTCYKAIIRMSNAINAYEKDELDFRSLNTIDILLAGIQKEIGKVFELSYMDITAKSGIITSKVLGGRYNFSGRSIIVPNSGTLRSDEVLIGYIPALELFRYEIQNEYRKVYNCSPAKANMIWKRATTHFDSKIYAIIKHLIADAAGTKKMSLIINRNPSINYGSFMCVQVVGVKDDINDKTLTLSTHIIVPPNADFDGDLFNVFRIIGEDFQERFAKNLNPRYNLFISRMTGKANREVLPVKDELVAFWAFNNM